MLSISDRQVLIEFLRQHADGDVLVQAANRVANNLDDVENLKKFIAAYKNSAVVPKPGVGRDNAVSPPPEPETPSMPEIDNPEDLGPAPKKLGSNGQAIQKVMEKDREREWSVDGLVSATKIAKAKVKPMLALLLEREIIVRVSNTTYQIK